MLSDQKKSFMNEFLLKGISSKELEKLLVLMESRKSGKNQKIDSKWPNPLDRHQKVVDAGPDPADQQPPL